MPILRLKEQWQQPKCIEKRLKIIAQMLQTDSELDLTGSSMLCVG
jgi:hypothetical protein